MTASPILFVSHEAMPTGAPYLLLHLLRWLRDNSTLDFKIALMKTGPLLAKFAELAPVVVFERPADSFLGFAAEHIRPYRLRGMLDRATLRRSLGGDRLALVYSNTLVNGKLLASLPDQLCPVISHVHELDYVLRRSTTPAHLHYTLSRTSQFIAGSGMVARNLAERHAVPAKRIEIVHEFIPGAELNAVELGKAGERVRAELGIAQQAFVAGAAGTVDWRKGYDLFVPLALSVLRTGRDTDMHFVWVGSAWDRHIPVEIAYDLQKLGLEKRVHFVGHRDNYLEYLSMFDALCLTSREDPFPLVVLEAAALGKPIICFAEGGGAPEFVEDDCGFVVPYLDVPTMAARLLELMADVDVRHRFGRRGAVKVRERHDVTVAAPRIAEIIQRAIASSRRPA